MRTTKVVWPLLGFALAMSACATSEDGDEAFDETEQDILGGTPSGDRSVVAVRAAGSLGQVDCTGVVVAPDAVITAAHCVHAKWVGSNVSVKISGKDKVTSTGWIRGYAPILHPQFNANQVNAGHDIAVILLRSNYTSAPPAVLSKWTLPAAWASSQVRAARPTTLRVVGYGARTDSLSASTGTRRERMVPLTNLVTEFVVAGNGIAGQQCHGDSGGPTFLGYDGAWNVVGIASHVHTNCQTGNWGTRIDTNYAFLRQALGTRIPATLLAPPATFPGQL